MDALTMADPTAYAKNLELFFFFSLFCLFEGVEGASFFVGRMPNENGAVYLFGGFSSSARFLLKRENQTTLSDGAHLATM